MNSLQVITILSQLTEANNAIRGAAEKAYDQLINEHFQELPLLLLDVIGNKSIDQAIQKLAAVLLRRFLSQHQSGNSVSTLTVEALLAFRSKLLIALDDEKDVFLKARICDIVAFLCPEDMEDTDWPELLPYTYKSLQVSSMLEEVTH